VTNPAAGMPCPVCKVPLVMSERQGVEIDYCPQCRGVWLDRGELDKIIERSAGDAAPAAPQAAAPPPRGREPYYGDDDGRSRGRDDEHRHGRRRKSFFEELFD
jgi:Zn-finger nucleic acid-binding protein